MLKDENGNRLKLNAKLFNQLMEDDQRTKKEIMDEIAKECPISLDAVIEWKRGNNSPGDLKLVKVIAKILKVDYKLLVCEVSSNKDLKEENIEMNETQNVILEIDIQKNNIIDKNEEYLEEIDDVEKEMLDVTESVIEDSVINILKKRWKDEQFKKSVYIGLVAFISMWISSLIDRTGDFKMGWGFLLIALWAFDYLLHHFPNIYDIEIFNKDEIFVRGYRVINLGVSAFVVCFVVITQFLILCI